MKNLKSFFNKNFCLLLILLLAIGFRLYKINTLTTFGRDQGIDFLAVRDMIVNHNLTLLGIKVSIAEFFQGPVYRYLLIPAFFVFKLHPIAGAYTAIFISLLTFLMLYATAYKFTNKKIALYSCLLFAVSPEFIKYGNTPLYQHFVPLCILISLFFLYQYHANKKSIYLFLSGLSCGVALELHFLAVTFLLASLIYLLFEKKLIIKMISFLLGLAIGLSPTIIFELRHSFLNTKLFIEFIRHDKTSFEPALLKNWLLGAGNFLGGNSTVIGVIILVVVLFLLFGNRNNKPKTINYLSRLTKILIILTVIISLFMSSFEPHYPLAIWTIFLILVPYYIDKYFFPSLAKLTFLLLISLQIIASVSSLNNNHGYFMPDGWNFKKIVAAGKIIADDAKDYPNFNVASLLDGDTRAYPLRYVVEYFGSQAKAVENYPQNNYLYVLARNENQVVKSTVWEIDSLKPFIIEEKWNLNEDIYLFRIKRQT